MTHIRDYTVTATQAADVYADIATALAANGWVKQGADITDASFTWRVWRNPAANSGLTKDFHVGIGLASTGTGSLLFRLFEDLVGGSRIMRAAPPTAFTSPGNVADAYGDKLHEVASGTLYAVPWTPGWGDLARSAGDFSVGVFMANLDEVASTGEAAILNAAPHELDLRSPYVGQVSVACDDSTAVEYVIHVTNQRLILATKLIFNTVQDRIYIGTYEPLSSYDTVPITMLDPVGGLSQHTRDWTYADLPSSYPDPEIEANVANFSGNTYETFGRVYGTITQNPTDPPTDADWNWRGPLGTRCALREYRFGYSPFGLLHTLPRMPHHASGGTPPIDFGDEVTINGVPHTMIYGSTGGGASSTGGTLWVPQT